MTATTYWSQRLQTGTGAGANVTANEVVAAHQTRFDLTAQDVAITHATGAGYGSLKIYDFPIGMLQFFDARVDLDLTVGANIGATATVRMSIGTTATANATLSGTEANLMPEASVVLVASAGTITGEMTATERGSALFTDGTITAKDLYINIGISSGVTDDDAVTCTGVVSITWINHGDITG